MLSICGVGLVGPYLSLFLRHTNVGFIDERSLILRNLEVFLFKGVGFFRGPDLSRKISSNRILDYSVDI